MARSAHEASLNFGQLRILKPNSPRFVPITAREGSTSVIDFPFEAHSPVLCGTSARVEALQLVLAS